MPFGTWSKALSKATANPRSLVVVESFTCMSDNKSTPVWAEPLNDAVNEKAKQISFNGKVRARKANIELLRRYSYER